MGESSRKEREIDLGDGFSAVVVNSSMQKLTVHFNIHPGTRGLENFTSTCAGKLVKDHTPKLVIGEATAGAGEYRNDLFIAVNDRQVLTRELDKIVATSGISYTITEGYKGQSIDVAPL